jgi:tetratricopeptide (TPR) repeat protein
VRSAPSARALAAVLAAGALLAGGEALAADAPVNAVTPNTAVTPPSSVASGPQSTAASGDVIFTGDPQAKACEEASRFGDFNGTGIDQCTLAIARGGLMTAHDMAATYTDRGAIYMQHKQFAQAKLDFDKAIELDANLGNAYVNRGGCMIALKRYADAIADIDKGLSLGPDAPEKAYYNRGIANEQLGDLKAAYADYSKALEINPNWAVAKSEVARFTARAAAQQP